MTIKMKLKSKEKEEKGDWAKNNMKIIALIQMLLIIHKFKTTMNFKIIKKFQLKEHKMVSNL